MKTLIPAGTGRWLVPVAVGTLIAGVGVMLPRALGQQDKKGDGSEITITAGADINAAQLADFLGIKRLSFGFKGAAGWRLVYDHWDKGKLVGESRNIVRLSEEGDDTAQIIYELKEGASRLRFLAFAAGGSAEMSISLGAAGKGNSGASTYGLTSGGQEKRIALAGLFFDIGTTAIEASRDQAVKNAKASGAAVVFYVERVHSAE